MKKLISIVAVMLLAACVLLCACAPKTKVLKENDEFIVITPSEEFIGKTLKDCMDDLKKRGELDFTEQDSTYGAFINSVNGIENTFDTYWMVYTDDAESSGGFSVEHEGRVCYLASFGASELVISKGCIYIWVYEASRF